jgi:hypothetical protein
MAFEITIQELTKQANDLLRLFQRTRDKKYKDEEVRIRRIISDLGNIDLGGSVPTLQQVTDAGAITSDAINVGGITTDYVQLDTTATPTPVQGMMFWDSDRRTIDVQLDSDVSAKIAQDNFWYVKNRSGATIPKGKAVRTAGTVGGSGRILIEKMVADGSISSKYLLGITAEDIANGDDGFVMNIGKLRQINTSGWNDGDVLYCDASTPGNLTSTKPSSPNLALPVAFVVNSAPGQNGTLAIRVQILDENSTGGSSAATWGSITGTLSNQTDLNDALNTKTNKLITTNRQTGLSYTLVLSDADKLVEMNNSNQNEINIPLNSSYAFPIGTQILVAQYGSGQTVIVPAAGVDVRSNGNKRKLNVRYSGATLIKIGTNEWYCFGDLVS